MAVSMTAAAAEHVRKSLEKRGKGLGLRLAVKPAGCSGFAYQIDFADAPGASDIPFASEGVTLYVDRDSLAYLEGTVVDYRRDGLNASFKFHNPNVKDSCGCGESFTV